MKRHIVLCSSAQFFKECIDIGGQLEKLGYHITLPTTACEMKKSGNFDVANYKTWYKDSSGYDQKAALIQGHFNKISKGDAILVVNKRKHDVEGYIGGNTLMEMGLAFYLDKQIYILNGVDNKLGFYEEILGMLPTFLNGDIQNIKN